MSIFKNQTYRIRSQFRRECGFEGMKSEIFQYFANHLR